MLLSPVFGTLVIFFPVPVPGADTPVFEAFGVDDSAVEVSESVVFASGVEKSVTGIPEPSETPGPEVPEFPEPPLWLPPPPEL